ncbi:swr complex subunit [Mortierella polycephala]|uniref:SWR1-complex protein 4 n=1 Tax=Mortierella polycephala TaxID=41804 RepID=A0A9P6U553_9FUNG|nr:swr complex subunit [Mortierella polycephala]
MATGNDVREIFQLKPSEQVRRVHKPEKKPEGISRELYGLIGNNVSTVAFNNPLYKPKLNVSKKAVNWTWRPFVNPSRDDDLVLHHWEKTRTDPNEEYRFYKFNKAINLIEFSAEDYKAHLQDSDWTLEETNYLWDLCRRFDLRWTVIQDRYEWPPQEQDRMALQFYNGNNLTRPSITNKTEEASEPATAIQPSSTVTVQPSSTTAPSGTDGAAMDIITETSSSLATPSLATQDTPTQEITGNADSSATTMGSVVAATEMAATEAAAAKVPAAEVPAAEIPTAAATTTSAVAAPEVTSAVTAPEVTTEAPVPSTSLPTSVSTSAPTSSSATTVTAAASITTAEKATTTPMEIVSFTPAKTRSMEVLKNRYYTINRILTKVRLSDASQAVERAQLLSSLSYDKNREMERKKNLEILNTRTPEQIEEEEALYLEARRIDQNEKKIARERENLLRLLSTRDIYGPGGPASAGLAGQVAGGGGPGSGIIISNNSITIPSSGPSGDNGASRPMSPSVGKNASGAAMAGGTSAQTGPVKKRKKAPKGSVQAEETASNQTKGSHNRRPSNASSVNDGPSNGLPPGVQVKKEKLTPGAYLRSQKMTPVVSTKLQRVHATLSHLGLPLKPSMPTATVMSKWDQLSSNIVTLLDIKKQVDKLESDLKVVKMRRGSASGVGLFPASGGGSGGASSADGNYGVKREGTADDSGVPGQVKKKKKKE